MSRIRGKDTKIETKVRQWLFHEGFRFRKNVQKLSGTPGIVLPKYKTVIFVHGCFWHRHPGCKNATTPKTRTDFWNEKFARNVANDRKNKEKLQTLGWNVVVVWECELDNKHFPETMERVKAELLNNLL
ncbi:MAG: DNA mismatch endonuclease Vsr [Oscillospiraceae bacterium]|jgi:DNA mismatch endonuclease (patch repair protein)|nr:DNA mismatch endonuclease Vsr [Oscillospiraceae bacterium]